MSSNQYEEMASFFDVRAEGYDQHMQGVLKNFDFYYESVAKQIKKTKEKIHILDLGCGTGNELHWIFQQAPNARITGIDMSSEMLKLLRRKFDAKIDQIETICGSYLDLPFGESEFDYVVSVYTMHHFIPETKLSLYQKIKHSLKPDGKYIEGDYVVSIEKEEQFLNEYFNTVMKNLSGSDSVHFDIPFSVQTQLRLFKEAGFANTDPVYTNEEEEAAIIVASV